MLGPSGSSSSLTIEEGTCTVCTSLFGGLKGQSPALSVCVGYFGYLVVSQTVRVRGKQIDLRQSQVSIVLSEKSLNQSRLLVFKRIKDKSTQTREKSTLKETASVQ